MKRCPYDLNNKEIRENYIKNHISWFFKNHEKEIAKFLKEVKEQYKE